MKSRLILLFLLLSGTAARAQEGPDSPEPKRREAVHITLDTRFDFDAVRSDGATKSGFHGRYLNLILEGTINKELSYHFRQRLNKFKEAENDLFAATDWLYIDYKPSERWTLSAGKQVVAVGGYEYDRAPVDVYYASIFWNNIACYQFGVSGTVTSGSGRHALTFQVCNSPYVPIGNSCFAYNLLWSGKAGPLRTLWSLNVIETRESRYDVYVALGNRLTFGRFYTEIDFINRGRNGLDFWCRDYSLIGKACLNIGRFDLFAKGGFERYIPEGGLPALTPAVEQPFYGGGVEFFPLKRSRNLRIHATASTTHTADNRRLRTFNIGLRWKIGLYNRE